MLNRSLLPVPRIFWESEIGKISRPSRGWSRGNCPFHESKSKKSFSVNLDSGGFYCFGCQVKGGDIVAFVMLRDRLTFRQACEALGAWEQPNGKPAKLVRRIVGRDLVFRYEVNGTEYTSRVHDDRTDDFSPYQWALRRTYSQARERLAEIRRGEPEKHEGETAEQWDLLACAWELIQLEVTQ